MVKGYKECHSPSNSDSFSNALNDALWLSNTDLILGVFEVTFVVTIPKCISIILTADISFDMTPYRGAHAR